MNAPKYAVCTHLGMVKSPVEGSTISMVKVELPVTFSDFVRPICLPDEKLTSDPDNLTNCNTLGWARNRDMLQRVQVAMAAMDRCENVSISTVNSLCTEAVYGQTDCNVSARPGRSAELVSGCASCGDRHVLRALGSGNLHTAHVRKPSSATVRSVGRESVPLLQSVCFMY